MGEVADDTFDAMEQLERALEECCHEDFNLDILTNRATCCFCGHVWNATPEEITWAREFN